MTINHEVTKDTKVHEAFLCSGFFVRLRVLRAFVVDRRLRKARSSISGLFLIYDAVECGVNIRSVSGENRTHSA